MNKKPYLRIDVNVFREILKNKYCPEEKGTNNRVLLEMIQELNKINIRVEGINKNRKELISNINFCEYGFKEKSDAKIDIEENIFDARTLIILTPKNIYELEDFIKLPIGKTFKQKKYIALMSDTFERLKVKTDNILKESQEQKHIEFYASKNIQMIARIFYEAKILLKKVQNRENENNKFFVYVQTIFIMNTILYLQNMFSFYYKEKNYSKTTLGYEIFETVGTNIFAESTTTYGTTTKKDEEKKDKIIWKLQINQLITICYDLMKADAIDVDANQLKLFILKNFLDKNGNEINSATINTGLKDYRPEKRAHGEKRIDISKYIQN
jgi:hypothetical protein